MCADSWSLVLVSSRKYDTRVQATCRMLIGQMKLLTMQLAMSHTMPPRCFQQSMHAECERQSKCIVAIWPCVFSFHFNLTILPIGLPFISSWFCIEWTMCPFSSATQAINIEITEILRTKIYFFCFGHRSLTDPRMMTIFHEIFRLLSSGQYTFSRGCIVRCAQNARGQIRMPASACVLCKIYLENWSPAIWQY